MPDVLVIDKEDSFRERFEVEEEKLVEYYCWDKASDTVRHLSRSTLSFLRLVMPENGENTIELDDRQDMLVIDYDVWSDVVSDCMSAGELNTQDIIMYFLNHEGSYIKEKEGKELKSS